MTPRLLLFLAAVGLIGCAPQSTTPALNSPSSAGAAAPTGDIATAPATTADVAGNPVNGGPDFLDLTVGNHAIYDLTNRSRTRIPADAAPGPWTSVTKRLDRVLSPGKAYAGPGYITETEYFLQYGNPVGAIDLEVRQDHGGYYLYQPAASGSADASAGGDGPRAGEVYWLRYPLHPGQEWVTRSGPPTYVVEARENVTVPAGTFLAWRVGVKPFYPGEVQDNHWWWGAPGEVAHDWHAETPIYGNDGQEIGVTESEEIFQLKSWTHNTL